MNKYTSLSSSFIATALSILRTHISNKSSKIIYVSTVTYSDYLKDIILMSDGIKYQVRMEQGYYDPCSFIYQVSNLRG